MSPPAAEPHLTAYRSTNDNISARDALEVLLWFGSSMLVAGNTATRTREWIKLIARKMGFEAVSVSLSLQCITATVGCSDEYVTAMREVGQPAINAWRIAELEKLAKGVNPGGTAHEISLRLAEIESSMPLYSKTQIVVAVAMASGCFAFINGAATTEMMAAAIGGGFGQWMRMWLSHRQFNQFGAAALAATAASGVFVAVAALIRHLGFEFAHYPAGFIASVLFLIPGFPLVAGLFDLVQYQTNAAVGRLAYGTMILLAVALGLSIVIEVAGIDLSRQPPLELTYSLKLILRAIASFVAACAFAVLFNSSARTALAAGLLALAANSFRLALTDISMMLAPAAFFAALLIGLAALLADVRFNVPRMAMTVAPIVIMMPGVYAFEMIVLFNRGRTLEALQASASCGFVIGALAMGLATARIFRPK